MAVYQWKVQKSNSCSFHTWMSQLLFTIYQNPKEVDPNARENGLASKSEATPAESVNLLLPCPLHVHRRCGSHWRWIFPSQLNWEKKTDTKVIPNDILLYPQISALSSHHQIGFFSQVGTNTESKLKVSIKSFPSELREFPRRGWGKIGRVKGDGW